MYNRVIHDVYFKLINYRSEKDHRVCVLCPVNFQKNINVFGGKSNLSRNIRRDDAMEIFVNLGKVYQGSTVILCNTVYKASTYLQKKTYT